MSEEYLSRFAATLIKNNGHLGEFDVDVLDYSFAERLKKCFEELGCVAKLSNYTAIVTVSCPPEAFQKALTEDPIGNRRL
jgi:hypothetical protein